MNMQDFCKV